MMKRTVSFGSIVRVAFIERNSIGYGCVQQWKGFTSLNP